MKLEINKKQENKMENRTLLKSSNEEMLVALKLTVAFINQPFTLEEIKHLEEVLSATITKVEGERYVNDLLARR